MNITTTSSRKLRGFSVDPDATDFDIMTATKTITGRLTPLRYRILRNLTRRVTRAGKEIYGVSPNGYAYTCGHEHDCCGCIYRENLEITIRSNPKSGHTITLTYSAFFNY